MTIGAAVVLLFVGLVVAVLVSALGPRGSAVTLAPDPAPLAEDMPADGASGTAIFVHLLGAVERPGLYQLREGDRAIDAVAAAGGFTPTADQSQLNLARPLSDGEQIYVPAVGEAPPPGAGDVGGSALGGGSGVGAGTPGGRVNLNTADLAALDTLPGVGPATAKAIIDWRDANGRFTAVEDLLSVTGIGEKTLAELRDLVTV